MSWLAFKLFAKKAWAWLKAYWYVPVLLLYTVVVAVVFRRDATAVAEVLAVTKDSYKKQVDVLNETHETEIEERDKILKEYNNVITSIENRHESAVGELDKKKKKRIKELVAEHHNNPHRLSKMLAAAYGITYVKKD